ncbi:MAG: cache domain-containing protein [Desulfobulbus sp.]
MKSSISRKILVPTLILIAIGLVTTLVVTYLSARQAAFVESSHRLQRETGLASRLIDNWLQARLIDLRLWAQEDILIELLKKQGYIENRYDRAQRFLATQQTGYPYLEGIFVADSGGNVLAFSTMAAQSLAQIRLGDRSYFQETMSGRQMISPLVLSKLTGNRIFVVTAPIKVGEEIKGIIGGVIDFSAFSHLFFDNYEDTEPALLSDIKGLVLVSSNPQIQTLPQQLPRDRVNETLPVEIQRINDRDHLVAIQPLKNTDWVVVITRSMDTVFEPLHTASQLSIVFAVILVIAISLIIFALFYRLLHRRLHAMIRVIDQVKQGDLSGRILQVPGKDDEVSGLAASFNQMIEQLETNIARLQREIQMREASEQMLSYHQQNLETIIAERSRALEREIIERQQIEGRLARSEKLEMIGTLAGGVAHDLNNILSGIVTYPDFLLLKLPPDSPLATPLRSIKRTGERAAAIVQDLLTLSGNRGLAKKQLCLNTLILEFLQSQEYHHLLQRHPEIVISCNCDTELAPIQGAPAALSKALLHLTGCAAMTMGQRGGGIILNTEQRILATPLQAYEQIEAGIYIVLEIKSVGQGLAPEHLARIFEPFYTSKKLGWKGTGLEMAVVLGTVKDHGGFVDCSSDIESGSCFRLYFPLIALPAVQ